jgi:hypothetical protein
VIGNVNAVPKHRYIDSRYTNSHGLPLGDLLMQRSLFDVGEGQVRVEG